MDFHIVNHLNAAQARELHEMFQQEWWTKERSLKDVQRMLSNTPLIIGLTERDSGRLAAFARVLSDGIFKAFILDVIVAAECRKRGIGGELMDIILEHPDLRDVKDFELYCLPELIPFYEQWGFTADTHEIQFMRLTRVKRRGARILTP